MATEIFFIICWMRFFYGYHNAEVAIGFKSDSFPSAAMDQLIVYIPLFGLRRFLERAIGCSER